MNIRKQFKKEHNSIIRNIIMIIIIMSLIPYMMFILNEENIFEGAEFFSALMYGSMIDLLLLSYIIKLINDNRLTFSIYGRKLKTKRGLFGFQFSIPTDRTVYVDVADNQNQNQDFEIIIIMKKWKRDKNFVVLDKAYIKKHSECKGIYEYLSKKENKCDYTCVIIQHGGAKKFEYLHTLYRNAVEAEFSPKAIEYIKKYIEEFVEPE